MLSTSNIPKILLVNMPAISFEKIDAFFRSKGQINQILTMPLGLMYLSSYVKKHLLCEIDIFDFNIILPQLGDSKETVEKLRNKYSSAVDFINKEIDKFQYKKYCVIGYSLNFTAVQQFFEIAVSSFKRKFIHSKFVVGGVHASNSVEFQLRNTKIDFAVCGEGEVAFLKIIESIVRNEQVKVKGVYSNKQIECSDKILTTDKLNNLDELPFPDWDLLHIKKYLLAKGWSKRNCDDSILHAYIMTSRGCPNKCSYCSTHSVHGRKIRYLSVEKVVSEVATLYEKYGVTLFLLLDDFITANKKRLLELLKEIRKLNIPNLQLQFPNGININTVDEEIIDAMIKTGTNYFHSFALESGSKYVQNNIIKKRVGLEKAKEIVSICRSKGIIVRCNIIFGFPGETKELMDETVEYIKKLGADWYPILVATPLIGSELYDQYISEKYFDFNEYMKMDIVYEKRKFDTKEISAEELNKFIYEVNLIVNFFYNYNFTVKNYNRAIHLFQDVVNNYPNHIFGWLALCYSYKALNDLKRVKVISQTINDLYKNDINTKINFDTYCHLMTDEFKNLFNFIVGGISKKYDKNELGGSIESY